MQIFFGFFWEYEKYKKKMKNQSKRWNFRFFEEVLEQYVQVTQKPEFWLRTTNSGIKQITGDYASQCFIHRA